METTAELLNLDTSGDEPTGDLLTATEGNRPVPNFPTDLGGAWVTTVHMFSPTGVGRPVDVEVNHEPPEDYGV